MGVHKLGSSDDGKIDLRLPFGISETQVHKMDQTTPTPFDRIRKGMHAPTIFISMSNLSTTPLGFFGGDQERENGKK